MQPIHLRFSGHVPAIKNTKLYLQEEESLIISPESMRWIKRAIGEGRHQLTKQDYQRLPYPTMVACYARIWYHASPDQLPVADGDNAYTTLQEMLQPAYQAMGAGLNVVDDDRQILSHHVDVFYFTNKYFQGAEVFVWELTEPRAENWAAFWHYLAAYDSNMYKEDRQWGVKIDFDDIEKLLP